MMRTIERDPWPGKILDLTIRFEINLGLITKEGKKIEKN